MPQGAFEGEGRFRMANIPRTLNSSAESLTNLDARLDRLETGRAGDGEMTEAERALSGAQGQITQVGKLGELRETMVSQLQENATIAQTNPGLAALRADTLQRANRLAEGAPEPAHCDWKDYLTIEGGNAIGGPAMRSDLTNLNEYAADADKFITQRQTELNDRMQRSGDPNGSIGKELKSLEDARTQIAEAQASLRTANAQIGSDDAKAGQEMFGAAINLRLASGMMRDSVSNVRSEPR